MKKNLILTFFRKMFQNLKIKTPDMKRNEVKKV